MKPIGRPSWLPRPPNRPLAELFVAMQNSIGVSQVCQINHFEKAEG
jgi:hypothetical protein